MTTETSTPWSGPRAHPHAAGRAASPPDASRGPVPGVLREPDSLARTRVAEAPGRVDILGGLSEFAGVASLNLPVGGPVRVSVQPAGDGMITVGPIPGGNGHRPASYPLSSILNREVDLVGPDSLAGFRAAEHDALGRCIATVVAEAMKAEMVPTRASGFVVSIDLSNAKWQSGSHWTPLICATLAALCSDGGGAASAERIAAVASHISRTRLGLGADLAEIACVLSGALGRIQVFGDRVSGSVESLDAPNGVAFAAVDCGAIAEDIDLRNVRARTASMMGRALIARMVGYGREGRSWDGPLAHVSVTDYVEAYRDRIPTKLKGAEFLERVGALDDTSLPIEPEQVYRVRSRTEHHIYEQDRVARFQELLAEVTKQENEAALAAAGELLYASHWSYGQRCGMGSVETDLLVGTLRRQGGSAGVLGARVSGHGCGGMVCVMLRDTDQAWTALRDIVRAYEAKSGRDARILSSNTPGVLVSGVKST